MQRIDIRPLTIFLFVPVAFGQSTQERVFHFKPADAVKVLYLTNIQTRKPFKKSPL